MTATTAPTAPPHRVAIIGAGPTGCYTAQALRKMMPTAEITVLDASPLPYGLLRNGIAPDHQGMKSVSRQYDRVFTAGGVRFVGGVRLGEHLMPQDLAAFDGVVLATGLERDRMPAVPIDPAARVIGAGRILRLLNGDPRLAGDPLGALGEDLVVTGTGNVAVDLLRLVAKTDAELAGSDIVDDARDRLALGAVRSVTVLGRGARSAARWDEAMMTELCALSSVHVTIDGEVVAGDPSARVRIDIRFDQPLAAVEAEGGSTVVRTTTGSTFRGDALITALGFVSAVDDLIEETERVLPVVVRAGGSSTGALGNLAQNRIAAKDAAARIVALLASDDRLPRDLPSPAAALARGWTCFEDWQSLDRIERERAGAHRCRRKLTSESEIRSALATSGAVLPQLDVRTA
ncbi:hypothetical protein C1N80_00715 [Brachybacterium sp. SGAir0954]|uniref:FAD-dependent oxidoreductase n=1 Tax=Brachybacterium sp. SGAir0954 TaxID=2571029 RepID=UPI0010CD55A9|nr:FAD-dependent oxidoreductase [Brachybacterium sp. SGAir0954]QCR52246.1 hypothetical protein C1N80_00715 [Brachybacterium sp. SGAir0954]